MEDIGISEADWLQADFGEDALFVRRNVAQEKTIIAYGFLFKTYEELGLFLVDYDIDLALDKIIALLGAEYVEEYDRPAGVIEDSSLRSVLVQVDNRKYVCEILKSEAENVGFVYFTVQPPYSAQRAESINRLPMPIDDILSRTKVFRVPYRIYLEEK